MSEHDMSREACPEAAQALLEAGWTPHPSWGVYTAGALVMGTPPHGQTGYVKNTAAIREGDKRYGADTPDTHIEAARWLIAHDPGGRRYRYRRKRPTAADVVDTWQAMPEAAVAEARGAALAPAPEAEETPAHEAHGEIGGESDASVAPVDISGNAGTESNSPERNDMDASAGDANDGSRNIIPAALESVGADVLQSPPADEAAAPEQDSVDSGTDAAQDDTAEHLEGADAGSAGGGGEVLAHDGQAWPSDSEPEIDYEADYEEIGDDAEVEGADVEALALEDQSEVAVDAEPAPEPQSGVAYFGDDIHVARLAKMGRLAEIARELKAVQHEGWTVGEFASLQNLLVRVERGEAPDDGVARARFLAISERSRAISAIDAYQNGREDELERYAEQMKAEETRDQARDAILAFNPDDGWP